MARRFQIISSEYNINQYPSSGSPMTAFHRVWQIWYDWSYI